MITYEQMLAKARGGDIFLVIEDQWNVYSRLKEDLSNIGEEL